MAKVKGSYGSIVRGVSEQVPHDRLEGQHFEQLNLISDPIRGLIRRRGSMFKDKLASGNWGSQVSKLNAYREYSFISEASDYTALYCTASSTAPVDPLIVYNKETHAFEEVNLSSSALTKARNGITSAVSLGRYLVMSTPGVPSVTVTDRVAATSGDAAIWVRGGAYSRTYSLTLGSTTVSYTTPKSYYDVPLDTSGVSFDAPDYQKQVNDLVNAYNSAVNAYIADAQEAIQPENIAAQLQSRLVTAGFAAGTHGSHIHINGLSLGTNQVTGSDGGDGSFLRVTHRSVSSLEDLTRLHEPGTVVEVKVSSEDSYYVIAEAKRSVTTFQEVTWIEASGESLGFEFPFLIGTTYQGQFYVGSSPENLESILPVGHGLDVPQEVERKSGDAESNPLPDFLKRPVSYMTVLQDRLLVCSGANVFMSVPGDYFNWFRKSALRIDPDDPIEIYAIGAEDDVIRGGDLIDRNLILLGDSRHYAISGRDVLSPTNAIISVQATNEQTTDAQPKALGNMLFFGQYQGGLTKLHQMQVGDFSDSFANFSVTQQITNYIEGRPRQLVTSSQPNMVLFTTEAVSNGLYVFTFLDSPGQQQRLFDSWSRWEWNPALGSLLGVTASEDGFVVFTYRNTPDGYFIVADEFSRDSSIDDLPYLDSKVLYSEDDTWAEPLTESFTVLPRTHPRSLFGRPAEDVQELLDLDGVDATDIYQGVQFDAYFDPTQPYLRDRDGNAILAGRTVLTNLGITLAESAGIEVHLKLRGETAFNTRLLDDSGFRLSDPLAVLGAVPLTDRRVSCYVGREIREHTVRIASKSWTPFNVATIEWTVQTFNRR